MAELADAEDLKSSGAQAPCGFDPHSRHFLQTKRAHLIVFTTVRLSSMLRARLEGARRL
jgi:hypothetical protein